MARVVVLYDAPYGHTETSANAVAEGAHLTGAAGDIQTGSGNRADGNSQAAYFKLEQSAPIALSTTWQTTTPSSSALPPASAAALRKWRALSTKAGPWMRGALNGKVGGAFTSSATQHRVQESQRQVSAIELAGAQHQGKLIAETARKLFPG